MPLNYIKELCRFNELLIKPTNNKDLSQNRRFCLPDEGTQLPPVQLMQQLLPFNVNFLNPKPFTLSFDLLLEQVKKNADILNDSEIGEPIKIDRYPPYDRFIAWKSYGLDFLPQIERKPFPEDTLIYRSIFHDYPRVLCLDGTFFRGEVEDFHSMLLKVDRNTGKVYGGHCQEYTRDTGGASFSFGDHDRNSEIFEPVRYLNALETTLSIF